MKTIGIINHKGGVAKTTSVQNISAGLAAKGKRVLMIDLDPQANLTKGFGIFKVDQNIYHSFSKNIDLPILQVKNNRGEVKENLFIVPSSINFSGIEIEISNKLAREKILSSLLSKLNSQFDYCFLDCPPSLGLITINALVAANEILIPLEAEFYAYQGLDSIFKVIQDVKTAINPSISVKGVFLTKIKERRSITKAIRDEVKKHLGDILFETEIRENVAFVESQSNGIDIFEYDSNCNGANDYKKLISEFLKN
jgi:chromosome partitioning protein